MKKTAADLKKEKEEREQMKEVEMNRKAAWGAVKGAALVALAQQNLFMLPAEEEVCNCPLIFICARLAEMVLNYFNCMRRTGTVIQNLKHHLCSHHMSVTR